MRSTQMKACFVLFVIYEMSVECEDSLISHR